MGKIIAHEIGHVLLPEGGHAKTGIMRERLDPNPNALERFTVEQAEMIRRAITSKHRT
jgi:hypothetical protein